MLLAMMGFQCNEVKENNDVMLHVGGRQFLEILQCQAHKRWLYPGNNNDHDEIVPEYM